MRIKTLAYAVSFAALIAVIGCGRTDGVKPGSTNRSRPDGSSDPSPGEEPALKDADAYAARAYEWLRKGNVDNALKDYDRAVRLEPGRAAFWNGRGFTWHMKGIEDEDRPACEDRALSDYAEAIRLDPGYASAI